MSERPKYLHISSEGIPIHAGFFKKLAIEMGIGFTLATILGVLFTNWAVDRFGGD